MGGGTVGIPITGIPTGAPASTPTRTHFPLELFRREMSIHPFHFWQLSNASTPLRSACNALLFQHAWQDADKIGRADIQAALGGAVDKLATYLGYSPILHFAEETLPWPTHNDKRAVRYPYMDTRGRWMNVRLKEGQVQALGVESLLLLNDLATVGYSDADGDGLDDTFSVTLATTVTDPSQIAAYFSSGDRLTDEMGDWRIEPISVSIAGGIATITGPAWVLVKPALYQGVGTSPLDPASTGTFVSTLAVYQRSVYTAGTTFDDAQCTLLYESRPAPWWGWNWANDPTGGSTDPAVVGYAVGRGGIKSAELGEAEPVKETYDSGSGTWSADSIWTPFWEPDRVTVRYLAGWPLTAMGQIDHRMVQLVSRFAVAEMPRPLAACQEAMREIYYWQFDVSRAAGAMDEQYRVSQKDLDNPFGTRRGQVWAWKTICGLKTMQAVLV